MTSNRSVVILIVMLLLASGILLFLFLTFYEIQTTNREVSELINTAKLMKEERASIQSARMARNLAAEEVRTLQELTFGADQLVSFIEDLESVGKKLGLDVNIISVNRVDDKKKPIPYIIRISLEAKGGWSGTFSFLQAIENLPYKVIIEEAILLKDEVDWSLRTTVSVPAFK